MTINTPKPKLVYHKRGIFVFEEIDRYYADIHLDKGQPSISELEEMVDILSKKKEKKRTELHVYAQIGTYNLTDKLSILYRFSQKKEVYLLPDQYTKQIIERIMKMDLN